MNKMGNPKEAGQSKKAEKNLPDSVLLSDAGVRAYGIPCRFDVAAVLGEQIEVVKNAFEYLP